jgi:beta-lactamase regulating signal transducer with metallopeptidase domain
MSPLLDLAIRATILLALAGIAASLLGRAGASAAMRHAVWALGIGGLLALPLLSLLLPSLEILPAAASAAAPVAGSVAATAAVAEPYHWEWFGWGAYAAIVALLLLRILVGRLRLARLWRAAVIADRWGQTELDALAREAGILRRVRLRFARGPVMPMTWGTLAPKLVLPMDACGWTAERRRFVLLHELAHVARCDSLGTLAASLACALYWFHPAIWLAASRLRTEQEHAADDLVLASGAGPLPYARDLLALAAPARALPAPAMARTSQLEQRLTAIVGTRSRRRTGPGFVLGAALAALGTTMLVAAAAPRPAPLPPAAPVAPAALPAPATPAEPSPPTVPSALSARLAATPTPPPVPLPPDAAPEQEALAVLPPIAPGSPIPPLPVIPQIPVLPAVPEPPATAAIPAPPASPAKPAAPS